MSNLKGSRIPSEINEVVSKQLTNREKEVDEQIQIVVDEFLLRIMNVLNGVAYDQDHYAEAVKRTMLSFRNTFLEKLKPMGIIFNGGEISGIIDKKLLGIMENIEKKIAHEELTENDFNNDTDARSTIVGFPIEIEETTSVEKPDCVDQYAETELDSSVATLIDDEKDTVDLAELLVGKDETSEEESTPGGSILVTPSMIELVTKSYDDTDRTPDVSYGGAFVRKYMKDIFRTPEDKKTDEDRISEEIILSSAVTPPANPVDYQSIIEKSIPIVFPLVKKKVSANDQGAFGNNTQSDNAVERDVPPSTTLVNPVIITPALILDGSDRTYPFGLVDKKSDEDSRGEKNDSAPIILDQGDVIDGSFWSDVFSDGDLSTNPNNEVSGSEQSKCDLADSSLEVANQEMSSVDSSFNSNQGRKSIFDFETPPFDPNEKLIGSTKRFQCHTYGDRGTDTTVNYTPFRSSEHAVYDSGWSEPTSNIDVSALPPVVETPKLEGQETAASDSCWTAPENLPPYLRYVGGLSAERPRMTGTGIDRSFSDAFTEAFEKYFNSNEVSCSTYDKTPTGGGHRIEMGLPENYKVVLTPTPTGVSVNLLDLNDPRTYEGFIKETFKDDSGSQSK